MTSLPRSTPVDQGVDPAAVLAFVDAVDKDPLVELHSLMVVRHGQVVAEGWWAPHTPERTRLLYSLSKSFTSTALAFALDEGLLGLDDTLVSHFPELDADIKDPRSRSITLRHLVTMSSGHDRDLMDEAMEGGLDEPVPSFLMIPPDEEPGSIFAYNQPCTYSLAAVIQRKAAMPLSEYLRPRLFDPLGIGDVGWQSWPAGRELGFTGLFARTEDVAKLGQLYLRRGRWGDRQLIPEQYVEDASARHIGTENQENVDWQQGYGYQFWMARHGYRGDGAFGQFCIVLPELDTVIALTGGTEAMQQVLDHLWERLLPGLGAEPARDAQHDLEERLRALSLPPSTGQPSPSRWEDWTAAPFAVTTESLLTSVAVSQQGERVAVTLHEPDNSLTVEVGSDRWLVSDPRDAHGDVIPVASSGGWVTPETLRVEAIFLESPHRLDLECTLPSGTAEASWRGTPLGRGQLAMLHCPARH